MRSPQLKTRASTRVISADDVLNAVTAHMRRWPPGSGQLLITNRLGHPVQRSSFGDCWREAVRAAGLPRGTRFHDLRHFCQHPDRGRAAPEGDPGAARARDHRGETMDTYGHLFPDASEHGRGAIDAMSAPADVRPMCAWERS